MLLLKIIRFFCAFPHWIFFSNVFLMRNTENIQRNGKILSWKGSDPQVNLQANSWLSPKLHGFYMFEVSYRDNVVPGRAELYVDFGGGFNELDVYVISLKRSGMSKRVCYFPKSVKAIRFDPSSQAGELADIKFRFVKLSNSFATKKMRNKLLRINNTPTPDLKIQELIQYYNNSLNLSVKSQFSYANWISDVELSCWSTLAKRDELFSIVLPTYNTPIHLLKECIESVINQTYDKWELIVVDDASESTDLKNYLFFLSESGFNIKVVFREVNGHISAATNTAIEKTQGDYICFLDHDDVLSPHALNEVAVYLSKNSQKKVIYSDEDKINLLGERTSPYFKPDFNYELLLSHNYISHFSVIKKEIVNQVGGLRIGFEGSQDYDLILRCLKVAGENAIGHISKILYHWRIIQGSTALAASEKSYSSKAGLKALQEYLSSSHCDWSVGAGPVANSYKVTRDIIGEPLVSIVIPTRNQCVLLKQCIDSIRLKTTYRNYEIIVVDNGSDEIDSLKYLESLNEQGSVQVISYDKPFNYSAINNYAINNYARGEFVLLMNNDVEVVNDSWLNEMLQLATQKGTGCVGAKLHYPNDTIQHAGVTLGIGGVAGHTHKHFPSNSFGYFSQLVLTREVSAVTAAVLLIKKSIYSAVEGLDDVNLKVAFNDVDFCLKVRQLGFRNIWSPYANLYHHESVSRGAENTPEKQLRFNKEVSYMKSSWGDMLTTDPFYNINLSNQHEDFSLGGKL